MQQSHRQLTASGASGSYLLLDMLEAVNYRWSNLVISMCQYEIFDVRKTIFIQHLGVLFRVHRSIYIGPIPKCSLLQNEE